MATNQLPELSVSFQNSSVEALRAVDVAFADTGTEYLSGENIIEDFPVIVDFNGIPILGYEFVYQSSLICGFSVDDENVDFVSLIFDHMNPGDGCVIRFFLDETEEVVFSVNGEIRKAGLISPIDHPTDYSRQIRIASFFATIIGILMIAVALPNDQQNPPIGDETRGLLLAGGIFILLISMILSSFERKIVPLIRKLFRVGPEPTGIPALAFAWRGKFPHIAGN